MLNNKEINIITRFIEYTKMNFDIDFSTSPNSTYDLVKKAFTRISRDKLPIFRLEAKISKKKQDYEDVSRPYVRGESYGGDGGGSPINSFKVSFEENIHVLRAELEEEISSLTVDKLILEKQLKKEFDLFEEVLTLLPNETQRQIFLLTFLENKKYVDISIDLSYSYNTICQYVSNGIRDISKKIKQYRKI